MPNILLDLEVNRVDLVEEGSNSEAFIKLYKRKETCDIMEFKDVLEKMKPEHVELVNAEIAKAKDEVPATVVEELAKAKADLEIAATEVAKAKEDLAKVSTDLEEITKAKEATASEEDVIKSLDPEVQKIFKSLQTQKVAAEEVAKSLQEQKLTDEAVAKASGLKNLPVEQSKLVEIVKSASVEVYEVLKAANKTLEDAGIFQEVGKSSTDTKGTDAWDTINKKAEQLVESEKITIQKAIAKVIKEEPELYREYLKGGM